MSEHIVKRGSRYYYRRRVPADLVEQMDGKREHTQALGTSDRREAERAARRVAVELDDAFDKLRRARTPKVDASDPIEMWESAKLFDDEPLEVQIRRNELRDIVSYALDARDRATAALLPTTQATPLPSPPKPASGPEKNLEDARKEWERAREPGGSSKDQAVRIVARFEGWVGRKALRSITRDDVRLFQTKLAETGIAATTVRQSLKMLTAILSAAVDADWIKDNPALGVKTKVSDSAGKARIPFTPADVKLIMGNLPADGNYRWMPLVGLYTGMRLEEIGQLAPDDIRTEHYRDKDGKSRSVPVIYATDEGAGQGLKNAASRRRIPVHNDLIAAGFLDYVKSQTGTRIFPGLIADRNGRETSTFSATFGRRIRRLGITDSRKTFHSARHLFKDILREHGVEEAVSDALTGHTNGSVSRSYGGEFFPLRPLVEAISKFEIHGLELK